MLQVTQSIKLNLMTQHEAGYAASVLKMAECRTSIVELSSLAIHEHALPAPRTIKHPDTDNSIFGACTETHLPCTI
jgi:hypothetical protein